LGQGGRVKFKKDDDSVSYQKFHQGKS